MSSLRNRIAALLILSIVSVAALASLAAVQLIQRPLAETALLPVTQQIGWLIRLADADPETARAIGMQIADAPARGRTNPHETRVWTRFLSGIGVDNPLTVIGPKDGTQMTVSVDLRGSGWLVMPLPDMRPPRAGWIVFASWLAIIVAGAGVVSVIAAHRITGPLRLLNSAADRIGADGLIEPLPESGLPETRATARALNRLSGRLKSAMESRMRLVAAAGHDLRTPMTRMRLRAEFIEDDAERDKWLADLSELDTIADSAIRLVRDEVSAEPMQDLRLDQLLTEITQELGLQGHAVTLSAPLPLAGIRAQPVALARALRNLIINAATHGQGAEISLQNQGDWAEIRILDHGPGIPEPLLTRAFEPFFRVDPARRKSPEGAGLGMAIARQAVERLGGTITLENRAPSGLCQRVRLPLGPATGAKTGIRTGIRTGA